MKGLWQAWGYPLLRLVKVTPRVFPPINAVTFLLGFCVTGRGGRTTVPWEFGAKECTGQLPRYRGPCWPSNSREFLPRSSIREVHLFSSPYTLLFLLTPCLVQLIVARIFPTSPAPPHHHHEPFLSSIHDCFNLVHVPVHLPLVYYSSSSSSSPLPSRASPLHQSPTKRATMSAAVHTNGDGNDVETINTNIVTLTRFLTEEQAKVKEATGDFTYVGP